MLYGGRANEEIQNLHFNETESNEIEIFTEQGYNFNMHR